MEYIKILRPNVCLLAILAFLVGTLILKIDIFTNLSKFIFSLLAIFLICSFGNVINDYFDREIDRINKPERPIPSGKIKEKVALMYAFILAFLGILISYFVSIHFFILAVFNAIIAFIYSWKFKKTIFGNLLDSYLASVCFIAPMFAFSLFSFKPITLLLCLTTFFGNYAREVFKDIEDIKGDKKLGAKTLPIKFGKEISFTYAKTLLCAGLFLAYLPLIENLLSFFYVTGLLPATGFCLFALKEENARKSQKHIKVAMFLVMFGFILGSIL